MALSTCNDVLIKRRHPWKGEPAGGSGQYVERCEGRHRFDSAERWTPVEV